MKNRPKTRIAFFDFTCCEGCQIELTNLGESTFMGLLEHVEFVEFREAMSERTTSPIDIAFIEGSFSRAEEKARLEAIRNRAKIVVAYGSCATLGGINALKNHRPDYSRFVYGEHSTLPHLQSQEAQPISAVIKVDYFIHGCPIDKNEFIHVVSHLLHGKEPVIPNHPVCVECKKRETVCRYQSGDHCLGLVARAGCGAPCPADGIPCEACRGFVDQPNEPALTGVLIEKGELTPAYASARSLMFTANQRGRSAK